MKTCFVAFLCFSMLTAFSQNKGCIQFFTGTTNKTAESFISLCELNPATGDIELKYRFEGLTGPGYVAFSPDKKFLYAVTGDHKIHSLSIDAQHKLSLLNSQGSEGLNPCHVGLDPTGKVAFLANYTGGSIAAYPIEKNGQIGTVSYQEQYQGTGPNQKRQEKAHAHCAIASKDGKYMFAADLGSDKLMCYQINASKGTIAPHPSQPFVKIHAGAGPRHLVTTPKGLYLLNELDATLCAFTLDKNGILKLVGTYPTIPADYKGPTNSSAAIRLHPNGKFVYVSNRGYNAVHGYRILANGTLESIGEVREAIDTPRDFNLDPSGKFMIVGNLATHDLAVYKVDPASGKMSFLKKATLAIKEPSCIEFL